jgi:hypothetical protein
MIKGIHDLSPPYNNVCFVFCLDLSWGFTRLKLMQYGPLNSCYLDKQFVQYIVQVGPSCLWQTMLFKA